MMARRIVYTDHRRFGVMDLLANAEMASHKLLQGIGVEPLGNEFSADYLAASIPGKKAPLKAALLDQRIIAGLGNIYVSEVLHRSRPFAPAPGGDIWFARTHMMPALNDVVRHVRDILNEAIAAGGSTLQDFSLHRWQQGRLPAALFGL